MKTIPQLMLNHEFDEKLMDKSPRIFNPMSILIFGFNGLLESFIEMFGFVRIMYSSRSLGLINPFEIPKHI